MFLIMHKSMKHAHPDPYGYETNGITHLTIKLNLILLHLLLRAVVIPYMGRKNMLSSRRSKATERSKILPLPGGGGHIFIYILNTIAIFSSSSKIIGLIK